MKYDIPVTAELSRDIYDLHTYDVGFSLGTGALKRFMLYLSTQAYYKAMLVCTDVSKGSEEKKSFDRGYVHGINEVLEMLRRGREFGRKQQFPNENKQKPPKIV